MVSRAEARDSLLPRSWPGGLDDVVEAVLTEENLVADEEGRGAEGAARDREFGVSDQLGLDGGILAFRGDFGTGPDRKSPRLNSRHSCDSRMTSSACTKKTLN